MSKDDIKVKWADLDADANFKFGEQSAGVKYREDTGAVTSLNLVNVNAKAGACLLKIEKEIGDGAGSVLAQGPSASAEVGVQWNHQRIGIDALAEASAIKAKASAGGAFLEANLNANTGAKIGTDGVKVGLLGFGITLGVGGRWSVDTPVGSVGGEAMKQTNSSTNTRSNVRYA